MRQVPAVVEELARELRAFGWVTDLLVAGSLATGDHVPGVSDLDLVAVVEGPVEGDRPTRLAGVHRALDDGSGAGAHLGCCYVDQARLADLRAQHPTWTHGAMVGRVLSGVTRAELVRHGFAVVGRAPQDLLPAMGDDAVRQAARAELLSYWRWAVRRPWVWTDPTLAELSLTSMARARHTLATGALLTKTRAVEHVDAPAWLVDQLRARRGGSPVTLPRVRTGVIAWRDARRTIALVRS